jgi:hypothetical protein
LRRLFEAGTCDVMLARVGSGALRGVDALVVDVEVDVPSGLPHTTTVGCPTAPCGTNTRFVRLIGS